MLSDSNLDYHSVINEYDTDTVWKVLTLCSDMSFCVGVSPQKRVLGDYPKHTHHVVLILNTHATWFNTKHVQAAIRAQQYIIIMASNKYNPMIGQAPKCRHCRVTIA